MSAFPMAAQSARETPLIPPNAMAAAMVTWASPPRTGPTRAFTNSITRSSIPERPMRSPARMKNGIASSGNESMAPNMIVGRTLRLA